MKPINIRALVKAVFVFIVSVTIICVIGSILVPTLLEYTPEDPEILSDQRNFAIGTALVGLASAVIEYYRLTSGKW